MKAWEENIRKVVPYIPGEQPQVKDIIKLNTNENPYPPSPGVKKAHEEMEVSRFALYPDPAAKELVTALESYHGLDAGQVFVGVGSDDVLALAFLTFFNSDKPILFPDVTYSFYPVWANVYRIPYECPKLTDDFRICPDDYKKENGGVVIANPNAPTSLALSRDEIEEIIAANQDVIVIVDEAYMEFENGATGVFVTTTADAPGTNRLELTFEMGKIVCEEGRLFFDKLSTNVSDFCKTEKEGFKKPEYSRIEIETDGQNEQHIGVLKAFAGHILRGTPLVAEGTEGIRGLTLSNAMHLSSWLDRTVELPLDEELFLRELNKKRATSRKKEDTDIVFDTTGTY